MSKTIRAKVSVHSLSESKPADPAAATNAYESISMGAVKSGGDNPEDNEYAAATPSCSISMNVTTPTCFGFFQQGKKYYVDFTEVPE